MKQRGRKSAAELSVAASSNVVQLPPPPKHLTDKAGELWRMVMASRSAEMIEPEAYPVLVEYCRGIEQADLIAVELEGFEPAWLKDDDGLKRYDKLLAMQDRLTKVITSCAVKLRLTPSTRFDANTAARVGQKSNAPRKPWQSN
jgi:phage terminase small subunit